MAKVSIAELQQRLAQMSERRAEYERMAAQQGGPQRHEVWRHAYLSHPYMVGASDERLEERFRSVYMNSWELTKDGKLGLVPFEVYEEPLVAFTHLLEEYGARNGGLPFSVIEEAQKPIQKYFEHGVAPGVRMFKDYSTPEAPLLVKYGKRQFLEPMFSNGTMRVANANFYKNTGFLDSIRDDETTRNFFVPTFRERLQGRTSVNFRGHQIDFGDDDIVVPVVFPDYFLLSFCTHVHHRMPTDFDADAAIVIKNPVHFVQRVVSTFLARHPGWTPLEGPVLYYDPYRDFKKVTVPEMAKHIGYAYQKEFRIAFKPQRAQQVDLEPFSLCIGSMKEYADFVAL